MEKMMGDEKIDGFCFIGGQFYFLSIGRGGGYPPQSGEKVITFFH